MPREIRANLLLAAASTIAAMYLGELLLTALPVPTPAERRLAQRERWARARHRVADRRGKLVVVRDLRRLGIPAWIAPSAATQLADSSAGVDAALQPLAGISGVLSVLCKELGPWVIFRADEYGFRNPAGQWSLPSADIAIVGDSYAQGWCVPSDRTVAARIRARYPATVAAGIGGAGPLTELGFLREYVTPLLPRVVLWFYCEENDLVELESEKVRPALRRYLDPGASQHLASRQPEVDAWLKAFLAASESAAVSRGANTVPPSAFRRIRAFLTLWNSRQSLHNLRPGPDPDCCDLPLFERVLRQAVDDVRHWGGHFAFVYLPAQVTLTGARTARRRPISDADSVRAMVARFGLPLIDLRDSLRHYGPPDSLYPFPAGHLTLHGNQVVADILLRYLRSLDVLRGAESGPAAPDATRPRVGTSRSRNAAG